MWIRKGTVVTQVPEYMEETIKRVLTEGWTPIPDPRGAEFQTAPVTVGPMGNALAPQDLSALFPPDSVPAAPAAPAIPAELIEELVRKEVERRIAAAFAENTAAREAFDKMGMGPEPAPAAEKIGPKARR